jgi:hypothetical protein
MMGKSFIPKGSFMTENKSSTAAVITGAAIALCIIFVLTSALFGFWYYKDRSFPADGNSLRPSPTAVPEIVRPPESSDPNETLAMLKQAIVPENDLYDLACRLQGLCNIPKTTQTKPYEIGDREKFWILDSDTEEYRQIDTALLYITDHTYFWAEVGANAPLDKVQSLMNTFENEIYPTNREFFGSEWTPGVDGDPHIFVIYADTIGHNIAGYFNSSDEFNPLVKKNSNNHETYVLGANQDLEREYTYSALAHEFVHMIQFPSDRNEVAWISEGFANLGAFINGYGIGSVDYLYLRNTDLQLNTWVDNSSPDFGAHYGQSFLFVAYFLDRFGETATKHLISNPANDLASIDDTLAALNLTDPATGTLITADSLFMDWAVTNFLLDSSVGDGRYVYNNYPAAIRASAPVTISSCPQSALTYDVHQYGVDYIAIECEGDHILSFSGSTVARLLSAGPYSGRYAFWSNKGDESDMTLTKEFDFTGVEAPITLSFHAWYDIENKWDYLYLEASEDGKTWQVLNTPSGTDSDSSSNGYGWGYTGSSNGWVEETIDLSQYAGRKVSVRFEYITDAGLNGEGFLLDDVAVEAAGYRSDFEADDGGWAAAGFVRIQNALPQTFRLALIQTSDSSVTMIPLNPDQTAEIPLSLPAGEKAYLVIAATTRFTSAAASYQIEVR